MTIDVEEARRFYFDEGLSLRAVTERLALGATRGQVTAALREAGFTLRARGARSENVMTPAWRAETEAMYELYLGGESLARVGENFGLGGPAVRTRFVRAGLLRRGQIERPCAVCGRAVPKTKGGTPRKVCSRRCASKRTQASQKGSCSRCGKPAHGEMCQGCRIEHDRTEKRERVLERIREWHRRYGEPPAFSEWDGAGRLSAERATMIARRLAADDWPSAAEVVGAFGSFRSAVKAGGFEPVDRRSERRSRALLPQAPAPSARMESVAAPPPPPAPGEREVRARTRNSETGTRIELARLADGWEIRCVEHGVRARHRTNLDARAARAHPRQWCERCAALAPVVPGTPRRRPAWLEEASALRARGESYARIAELVGVSVFTVSRHLDPAAARRWSATERRRGRPRAARRRAAERRGDLRRRGRCESCGGPMGWGNTSSGVCARCRKETREARFSAIAKLWPSSLTYEEMAERLGTSRGLLASDIRAARARGWDLPRRRAFKRAAPRKITSEIRRQVVQRWHRGDPAEDIAASLDISARVVYGVVEGERRNGVALGYRKTRRTVEHAYAYEAPEPYGVAK